MESARIEFQQTGGAPDKSQCDVRWCVNGETHKITVQYDSNYDEWQPIGHIRVKDIEFVSEGFNQNDRWVILRYSEKDGAVYQLVAEGPTRFESSFYYTVKIEKKVAPETFETIDDTLIEDMPEMELRDF